METLGLLAGIGHLPVDVAQSAKKLGYKVVAIAVVADTDPELPENADVFYTINVGKVGKILQTLKQHGVKNVTMIGKVTKEVLYKNGVMIPDLTTIRVLASLDETETHRTGMGGYAFRVPDGQGAGASGYRADGRGEEPGGHGAGSH